MSSRNRCTSNSILDFDNKLMESTKNFCKFLEDISKGVRFCKAAALQSIDLLKRAFLLYKNFNVHAKILITRILYRRRTPEAYLEPSRTSTMKPFCKKKPLAIFSKTVHPKCSTGF